MSLRLKYGHSQILLPTSSSSQHTIPSLPTATSGHSWSEALSQLHSPFAQLALSTSKSYQLHPQNTSFPPGPHRVRTATSLAWIDHLYLTPPYRWTGEFCEWLFQWAKKSSAGSWWRGPGAHHTCVRGILGPCRLLLAPAGFSEPLQAPRYTYHSASLLSLLALLAKRSGLENNELLLQEACEGWDPCAFSKSCFMECSFCPALLPRG